VNGRKLSNLWANIETLGGGIGDSLYGFRIYPIADLVAVMRSQGWMRRFDFDPEAVVRLVWHGLPAVNIPSPVRYLRPDQGGVSHLCATTCCSRGSHAARAGVGGADAVAGVEPVPHPAVHRHHTR
jgi:hypothetical protein